MSGYRPIGISGYRAFGMSVSPLSEEDGGVLTSGTWEPVQIILPLVRNHKSPQGFHVDEINETERRLVNARNCQEENGRAVSDSIRPNGQNQR